MLDYYYQQFRTHNTFRIYHIKDYDCKLLLLIINSLDIVLEVFLTLGDTSHALKKFGSNLGQAKVIMYLYDILMKKTITYLDYNLLIYHV